MAVKNIVLLGATGSVGRNVLRVIGDYTDRFRLLGISGHRNVDLLAEICRRFSVPTVAISSDRNFRPDLFPRGTEFLMGPAALSSLAALDAADVIVVASSGIGSLEAILEGIGRDRTLAIANKEAIVVGGHLIQRALTNSRAKILPLDSEHNAIFQCLAGRIDSCFHRADSLSKIILTASGGPFLRLAADKLAHVTLAETLKHPNWKMGQKITINSATLANKGLEIMEACWLFQLSPQQIEPVIHPQSIVHSLVQFRDGSTLAQLAPPSMAFPIRHCLGFPDRLPFFGKNLDLIEIGSLTFERPDRLRFPCLKLAEEAARLGQSAPCVFNAANESAVEAFIEGRINFKQIPEVIEEVLSQLSAEELVDRPQIYAKHAEAQRLAQELIGQLSC